MDASQTDMSIVKEFEKQIANYLGVRHAILCNSARTALRYSLLTLKIQNNDEVIVPDYACQILPITVFCSGGFPKFCDIEGKTFGLSSINLLKVLSNKTKAVILVHLYGIPVDPNPILEITEKRGVTLIDDAAQSLGSSIDGKKAGTFGDIGIVTFNKFLDVGLGAAAVSNDEIIADKIKLYRDRYEEKSLLTSISHRILNFLGIQSIKMSKLIYRGDNFIYKTFHITLANKHFNSQNGWIIPKNYPIKLWRSNNLPIPIIDQLMSAIPNRRWYRRQMERIEISLLKSEFDKIDDYLEVRRRKAMLYDELLSKKGIIKPDIPVKSVPSYLKYPIQFIDKRKCSKCIDDLKRAGFKINRYKQLHTSPFFNQINNASLYPTSSNIFNHILPLPITPALDEKEIMEISSIVNSNL